MVRRNFNRLVSDLDMCSCPMNCQLHQPPDHTKESQNFICKCGCAHWHTGEFTAKAMEIAKELTIDFGLTNSERKILVVALKTAYQTGLHDKSMPLSLNDVQSFYKAQIKAMCEAERKAGREEGASAVHSSHEKRYLAENAEGYRRGLEEAAKMFDDTRITSMTGPSIAARIRQLNGKR